MAKVTFAQDGIALQNLAADDEVDPFVELGTVLRQNRDEQELARFGKKQQLKRNFKLLSIVGLTCTLMITWESVLITFQAELKNGGPAGLVYGFLFAWVGNIFQVLVMAEMGSLIPVAGGQYNWVAFLAPESCSKFLSYLTGWTTFIAWQAGLASGAYLGGTMIQGLLVLNYPDYVFERWHGTLLLYAIVTLALFINTFLARILPQIESLVLVIHVLGFFGILIPLVYLAPQGTASEVFDTWTNGGGWATTGLSFFVGLPTAMFAFIGIDAAAHMAEEIENASTVIPRSMIASVALNGVLGLVMLIAVLFSIGNLKTVLNTPTGFPYIQIFTDAAGSESGGSAMSAVIIAAMIFGCIGLLATASRMTWAFARERGMPGWEYLSRVEPRTALPLYSIGLSVLISFLLGLINIASSAAFNGLVSLTIAGFYSCFGVSATVFLHRRLTTEDARKWRPPFHLGRWTTPVIIVSLAYTVVGFFFSFWPASPNPTAEDMNWSIAVFGGVVLFSMFYWLIWGRRVYKGPIIEVEVEGHDIRVTSTWRPEPDAQSKGVYIGL